MTDDQEEPRNNSNLDEAGELLDRTRRFLKRCAKDPKAAFETEDPEELRAELEDLSPRPKSVDDGEEPPVEHRRSA